MEQEHSYTCDHCKIQINSRTELKKHLDEFHMHKCKSCNSTFSTNCELEDHSKMMHGTFYTCVMCAFTGNDEVLMEDHILDKHITPEKDNMYHCDDCKFQCENKDEFGRHFKSTHSSTRKQENNSNDEHQEEQERLKSELRQMKINFDRLENMYHEALDEVNKVKSDYESKLVIANDKYCDTKAENEALKEKVDILFKLGRSYIENNKLKETENVNAEKTKTDDKVDDDVIEVDETFEDLENWTKSKMRGFKRVDPTANATKQKETAKTQPKNNNGSQARESRAPPPSRDIQSPPPRRTAAPPEASPPDNTGKYCHYFANYGKCNYEERTGEKCKFDHNQAPMCNSGINCSRFKCMFSHPRNSGSPGNGNGNFL